MGFPGRAGTDHACLNSSRQRRWPGLASMTARVEVQAAGALLAYLRETQKTSLGAYYPPDPLSPCRHPGPRRDDPAQPGAGTHPPRRQARGVAPERDRLLGDADGCAVVVRMAHVAVDFERVDRGTARGCRGAGQPVGPARGSEKFAWPVVRPRAAGGPHRHRPGDAPRSGRPRQNPRHPPQS